MQIQRIQSVYLLLAAIVMAIFTFMPAIELASDSGIQTLGALNFCGITQAMPLLLCLDVLIVVLLLITLFAYRNLSFQMKLCKINILLVVTLLAIIGITVFLQYGQSIATIKWSNVLPLVTIVLVVLAHKGIKHDKKLLSDSERIR